MSKHEGASITFQNTSRVGTQPVMQADGRIGRGPLRRLGCKPLALALSVAVLQAAVARAAVLDDIGVTALRLEQPTLTGAGVIVAQPEASTQVGTPPVSQNDFEVNPANAATPFGVTINYVNSVGATASSFPNGIGTMSDHADDVAARFYGSVNGPASGVTTVWNYEAGYFLNHYITRTIQLSIDAKVVNQSFIFGATTPADAAKALQLYDNYVEQFGTIFVSGVGNGGGIQLPASAYNVIAVAAYGGASSVGPIDGRSKPDITAPGDATSYSTPLVSGVATLLVQAGNAAMGGAGTQANAVDPRTVKALLLNGASKPLGWTHTDVAPLDTRYGAGIVNALQSYHDLAAGKQDILATASVQIGLNQLHPALAVGPAVGMEGWNYRQIVSDATHDKVDHYLLDLTTGGGLFALTGTLVWDRAANAQATSGMINAINNLDFYLYNVATGVQVAASQSGVDNVEHLASIVLGPGLYDLQVLKHGGSAGNPGGSGGVPNWAKDDELYALAWNTQTVNTGSGTITSSNGYFEFATSQVVPNIVANAMQVNAGTLLESGAVNVGSLTVNGTHELNLNSAFSKTNTLSILHTGSGTGAVYTGKLNLRNNRLVVQGDGTALDKANKLVSLNEAIFAGRNGGTWTGNGITSSTVAGDARLAIGVFDNAALRRTSWGGQQIDDNSLLVSPALKGDANLDGVVNFNDMLVVTGNWNLSGQVNGISTLDWAHGDLNGDGMVNFNDMLVVTGNWNNTSSFNLTASVIADGWPGLSVDGAGADGSGGASLSVAQVPEPASVALLAMGCAALLRRGRKQGHR